MKKSAALLLSLLCSFGSAPFAAATDHDIRRGRPLCQPAPPGPPDVYRSAPAEPAGRVIERTAAEKQAVAESVAPADWQAGVENDIRRAEYELSSQRHGFVGDRPAPGISDAYEAPNRAQGFRIRFTENGATLAPRSDDAEATRNQWTWGLRLARFGPAGNTAPVAQASPSVRANRAEYDHGVLTEWFVNDEKGLEQGFTIHNPVTVAADSDAPANELHLDLVLSGNLLAYPSEDRQSIEFRDCHGARFIRYGELFSHDARGRALPSRMEVVAAVDGDGLTARVRLVVNAAGAVYPITIDPLATSPAWTAESDQASAYFGHSVASAGDVNGDGYSDVIVGAWLFDNGQAGEGRGFVYLGSAPGLAASPAWTAESDQAGARFGVSVASAGDVNGDGYSDVIVGAPEFSNGQSFEGRAFLYLGSASGLAATPAWVAESDQDFGYLGSSVASAGDVNGDGYSDVIVGATWFDNVQIDEGRAFLYLGSASGLATSSAWTAESDQADAFFGYSVASAGDVNGDGYSDVIVGASAFDNDQTDEGRAFLYLGSASGLAASPAWTAESDQVDAYFGSSVASAGDVNGDGYSEVVVGAYFFDNGQANEGRAFLYLGSVSGLAAAPAWTAESDQGTAEFGFSVASAGDVNGDGYSDVIVGAYAFDNGQMDEGRAFLYLGSALGLAATPAWTAESDQATALFGGSVASAGDVNGDGYSDVIAGARLFDNGQTNEGRAFLYLGSAADLADTPAWTAESDQVGARFGKSVASAGDVNGDGYSDVIVGAVYFDNGQTYEGRAFLYFGSVSGLATTAAWTTESDQASAYFGYSVANAGDVNNDGYSDVVVGAPYFDNGQAGEGRAYLYLGSASGLASTAAWTAESDQLNASFGISVASAGDVNGDGYSDVIVGAPSFDNGVYDEGRAFLYLGSGAGLAPTPAWTAESDQYFAIFGISVASAGDVNGDGYSDVIVGAHRFENGQFREGRAFLYLGSSAGLAFTPAWTAESDQFEAYFGFSVASAGDVNGDGYSDVIVGAPSFDNGVYDEGRALLYLGSGAGLAPTPAWTAESDQASAIFGASVASAGDVNGDGYSDVIVGAQNFDYGESAEGRAFFYFGSASGLTSTAAWTAESDQAGAGFGASVASAGDVNGDGYSDVVVGAQNFDNGESSEGRAFLYAGNGGFGIPLLPRQFQSGGVTPIAPLCRTNSDSFQAAAIGKSPFGRGNLGLEWEVKALSVLLDGTATNTTAWSDSGTAGTPLAGPTVFPWNGPYHWRARLRYHPTTVPFQPASRWLSIQPGGWQQQHLRVFGAPVSTDLGVGKSDSPDPVAAGGMLTYTVTATNAGPDNATGVTVSDTLPAGVAFVSATPSQGTCSQAGGTVTCNLGAMLNGGSATIVIVVTAPAVGPLSNSVSISGAETDPNPANNNDTEATTVTASTDLVVTKTDSPDPVVVGATLTYLVTASNTGPSIATGVTPVDSLPASVVFVSATPTQGTCSQAGGVVTCDVGVLASGASVTITIVVTAPNAAGLISNQATISGAENDPDPSDNSDTETTTVTDPCAGETVAPVVTPPASTTVDASICVGNQSGATGNSSAPLAAFIAGGSATDNCDTTPTQLPSQVGGADIDNTTFFPIGTTTVTFRFVDDSGNIGSASADVTVDLFYGDLNEDNLINANDSVILANFLVGNVAPGPPPFTAPLGAADVNNAASVDSVDSIILANYLVGNITCLPQ